MFSNSKKSKKIPGKRNFLEPLRSSGYRQRCLIIAAVILFALIWSNYADSPVKGKIQQDTKKGSLTVEERTGNLLGEGILGGAVNTMPSVQALYRASYDLIGNEAVTTMDFTIYEGSGILSEDYPVPPNGDPFGSFRKDVSTYVVKDGDTPFDIAAKFDINTDTILWANNLRDGDIIRPGDKLLIMPINGIRVKISAKDTLETLAKKHKGKVPEIQEFNDLESDKLAVGSYLIIPDGEPVAVASQKPSKYTAPEYAKSTAPANNWLINPTVGYNWGKLHYNNAVDIANACGTPIYAAAAGKVIVSDGIGWNGGYGKNIKIQHPNGVVTHYAHASRLLVDAGEEVAQGQLIALMGTTGHSSGCHLHFEIR